MNVKLSLRSEKALEGVHPRLVEVVRTAYESMVGELSFIVTEGARTLERQKELLRNGATRTLNSKHIPDASGFSHAVDLAVTLNGQITWDWPLYAKVALAMKQAASKHGIELVWGGDWKTFKDGPHFEIARIP